MTVRWKPLLVLSGLFLVIAVVGFVAIASTLMKHGSAEILPSARAFAKSGKFEEALIDFKRAIQVDGKNPAIHQEMAAMFDDWAVRAPVDRRPEVVAWRNASLAEAAKYGKTLREPRRQLLASALAADDSAEGLRWAREVLALEPANVDAHYVLAVESLEDRTPVIPEVKRHIQALVEGKAPAARLAWVKARAAHATRDTDAMEAALAPTRTMTLPADADPVDRTALLRLRALDVETSDPANLTARVGSLREAAKSILEGKELAPKRVLRMSFVLQGVQKALALAASKADPSSRKSITAQVEVIDADVEAIFKKSLAAVGRSDLQIYLSYADHLRARGERDHCLEVVDEALKSKLATLPTLQDVVMGLHAVAIESTLSDTKDTGRFDRTAPHIAALTSSTNPRFQGLGHLFMGAIELERSGVAGPSRGGETSDAAPPVQTKLRASALNHLKIAAAQLPDVVEAQARYGVALVLSQEQGLGRQYLQGAMRLGITDPQYQIWAAWSVVQAGYPEEAEPIVKFLLAEVAAGRLSRELEGTLHLLSGEILQARRSPADLAKALAEYDKSYSGQEAPAAVQLRMAQIDVQLNRPADALKRIDRLRDVGKGGTSAEHLAVLTLLSTGKKDEAVAILRKAREAYPDSDELVGLESAMLVKDHKPQDADRVLADYLKTHPDNLGVTLSRASILSDELDDNEGARALLVKVADLSANSAPLVQLALLDLKSKDYPAATSTIAKIRGRWKEAAAADLLDAQLSLEQGRIKEAAGFFDQALRKDPGNKVVQFWKAQIDNRLGDSKGAASALEEIARQGSAKELEGGVSLTSAAQSALANLSLQRGEVDAAIRRFEGLRGGGLAKADRWQLAAAYTAKGQWPAARREIATILNDSKNPPTPDERVRAANFYRQNDEEPAALSQLDYVLAQDPAQPAAVATMAFILAESKRTAEAASLVRKAISASTKQKPPAVFFLMLAALENVLPPAPEAAGRAMAALDRGLETHGNAADLVQAKYRLILTSQGSKQAVTFLEVLAKDDARGLVRRLLADAYRDQNDLVRAELTLRELVAKNPNDAEVASALVRTSARQAEQAGDRNDRQLERTINEKTAGLIKGFRVKFPDDLAFMREDCELAIRTGDVVRATAVSKEIDQASRTSPVGPLLRARMFELQGRPREAADSYAEALDRNGMQPDARVSLGMLCLKLGRMDEALKQARLVLDVDQDRADAVLLEARALNEKFGSAEQTASRRAQAIERLSGAIKKQPAFSAGYSQIAEIQVASGQFDAAEATLRQGIAAVPEDGAGVARLVELMLRPAPEGRKPTTERLAAAKAFADSVAARDAKGTLFLALAVGFHKADQLESASDWAAKAAAKFDAPVVHLNYGDILLSLAERTSDVNQAKGYFRRAVTQYDLALKTQGNSVEAINNKAWILHSYLGETRQALEISTALLKRVDPETLPGEFFDTLGAIQESVGRRDEAEDSYTKGLRKSPDHPVLNYHMGKLILADTRRSGQARGYLERAFAGKDKLTPAMATEISALMAKARAN